MFDSFAYISKAASRELDTFTLDEDHSEELDSVALASRAAIQDRARKYVEYLGYHPVDIVWKTLENTTQLATTTLQFPMR